MKKNVKRMSAGQEKMRIPTAPSSRIMTNRNVKRQKKFDYRDHLEGE
jgi:hypothetical protein